MALRKLMLVPQETAGKRGIPPALMRERDAAKYLCLGLPRFRELVKSGAITVRRHKDGRQCVYLREDLDQYARSLEFMVV